MRFLSSERLSQHKYKTPEGYLICTDAILARTGKQTYRKNEIFADSEDDSEIEVDRPAKEVFSPATLASFENKPITVEHPDEDVNAGNHNEYSVGFVRDVHKGIAEGQDVMLGTLVITDAQTINEIENGEHVELSCGYDCDIVDEANPHQSNIRGNHVALCQQGRAGIARIVDSKKVKDSRYEIDITGLDLDELKDDAARYGLDVLWISGKNYYIKGRRQDIANLLREYNMDYEIRNIEDSIKDSLTYSEEQLLDYAIENLAHNGDENKFLNVLKNYYASYAELASHKPDEVKAYFRSHYRDSVKDSKFKVGEWVKYHSYGFNGWVKAYIKEKTKIGYKIRTQYGFEEDVPEEYLEKFTDSIKDAQYIKWEGKDVIIVKNPQEVREDAEMKEYITYNGKKYWWFEGKQTGKHYFVPQGTFDDSVKDDLVFGYTQKDLDLANNMLSKATTEEEKKLIESLIAKIKYEIASKEVRDSALYVIYADGTWYDYRALFFRKSGAARYSSERDADKFTEDEANRIIQSKGKYKWIKRKIGNDTKDDLIQSSSEKAFKKNIATEIKAGKSPEQAAAIAYSVKRKNDSCKDSKPEFEALGKWLWDKVKQDWYDTGRKMYYTEIVRNSSFDSKKKYEISYTKDSVEYINIIKANTLAGAIRKFKRR